MNSCTALLLGLALLWATPSRTALAQPAMCTGPRPWILVEGELPRALAETVRSDLGAGLAPAGVEVCNARAEGVAPPLAQVRIEELDRRGHYSLDVTDAVARKRLSRDVRLDRLPADGRALALAVAAEELLRASWAEPKTKGPSRAPTKPSPAVRSVAHDPPVAPRGRPFTPLGVRLTFERFRGGQSHFGADLFVALPVCPVVALFLAAGARRSLAVAAPHGSIKATALSAEAGISVPLWRHAVADVRGVASGRLIRVAFEPDAADGSTSHERAGWAMTTRLGLSFAFGRAGFLRSYSTFGAGLPLLAFSASDDGRTVTGLSVLELFASTGLAWEFP